MANLVSLMETDIDFGKAFWSTVRANKQFPANGAFWLFQPQSDNWHLMIATPRVDEVGPRKAYEELFAITGPILSDSTHLLKIELISPRARLYQALRSVFAKKASVEGTRLGNAQIGGLYIDDAYLYEIH
jgi:hypothetical protein